MICRDAHASRILARSPVDPGFPSIHQEQSVFKEFKEFAMRGNVVDMAVGIIIGGAFGTIVKSLVSDVVMPPIGLLLGNVTFNDLFLVLTDGNPAGPYTTLQAAQEAGAVTINYGMFIDNVVSFFIVAFAVFLMVKTVNKLKRQEEAAPPPPDKKDCPFCLSSIPVKATRCPGCTSQLDAA
jgi:large conductance mechanosensitive channel